MRFLFSALIVLFLLGCDMSHLEPDTLRETMREPASYELWQPEETMEFVQNLGEVAPGVGINRVLVRRQRDGLEFCVLANSSTSFTQGETVHLVEARYNLHPFTSSLSFFINTN